MFIIRRTSALGMAKSKTGSFWLTETAVLANATGAGGRVSATIDLGAYVDVGDQQAIAVERVDFITQASVANDYDVQSFLAADGTIGFQVSDLDPGGVFLRADDNSLIASGALNIDIASNQASSANDFYPDNFGKLDESRMVVNDNLYLIAGNDGADIGGVGVSVTARIKARIVKLSTSDWMAIAIQSTAADN